MQSTVTPRTLGSFWKPCRVNQRSHQGILIRRLWQLSHDKGLDQASSSGNGRTKMTKVIPRNNWQELIITSDNDDNNSSYNWVRSNYKLSTMLSPNPRSGAISASCHKEEKWILGAK